MFDCDFMVNNIWYHTSEQFIVVQKALLFGDVDTANAVMSMRNPVHMKWAGKKVKGLNTAQWHARAPELILPGLLAKFQQVNVCQALLLATGDRLIVEASGTDSFWGVGRSLDDAALWDRSRHRGQNVMGELLMTVRRQV